MKFDGKALAKRIEDDVKVRVAALVTKPKIVSVLVGDDPASVLYTSLKEQAANRVGIGFEVQRMSNIEDRELIAKISEIGAREDVTGLMIQLPLPGVSRKDTELILAAIPIKKDVDGLRYPESQVVPPVVKAIMAILDGIANSQFSNSLPAVSSAQLMQDGQILKLGTYVVVGAKGFVGSGVMEQLKIRGIEAIGVDREGAEPASLPAQTGTLLAGDVVISCVGSEGIIKEGMVKPGAIVIDVGAPKGDITKDVYQNASISVEVPGGVGPVTIACLMANAVELNDSP